MPNTTLIQSNISLRDKTWFRTGGNARYFCEPKNEHEFQQTLSFGQTHHLPIFVLGLGANILVSDDGFNGLVIRPQLKKIRHIPADKNSELVEAGAGVTMDELIEYCLDNNLSGLEEFSGIPGTVGGSVFINLHYYQFLLSQFLVSAQLIERETGKIINVDTNWLAFGYNKSKLHERAFYVVSATFKLKKINDLETAYAKGRRVEIIRHRTARYPATHTCGSFFRNFHEDEVSIVSNNKKMIYVAYYLDKIGIKGQLAVGDAIVSYQHANMIVNQANATSTDIINLAKKMQGLVNDQFGIIPQPECQLIGFKTYPLLQHE